MRVQVIYHQSRDSRLYGDTECVGLDGALECCLGIREGILLRHEFGEGPLVVVVGQELDGLCEVRGGVVVDAVDSREPAYDGFGSQTDGRSRIYGADEYVAAADSQEPETGLRSGRSAG